MTRPGPRGTPDWGSSISDRIETRPGARVNSGAFGECLSGKRGPGPGLGRADGRHRAGCRMRVFRAKIGRGEKSGRRVWYIIGGPAELMRS